MHTMELQQAPLGKRPRGLDAFDVAPAADELVFPMADLEALLVPEIDQAS